MNYHSIRTNKGSTHEQHASNSSASSKQSPGSANAVHGSTDNTELIQSMMEAMAAQENEEYSSDDDESEAMATNYDSDASADKKQSHRRRARSQSGARGRSRSRARVSESQRKKNLECIHCEDFGRDNRHPNVSLDNCYSTIPSSKDSGPRVCVTTWRVLLSVEWINSQRICPGLSRTERRKGMAIDGLGIDGKCLRGKRYGKKYQQVKIATAIK